jgi:RecA-family ATPase
MIYAHHFAKGNSGDKDVIDRAAGAGTFARDADALVTLTQLDTDNENGDTAWRTEYVIREFPPKKPYDVWFRYPLHEFDEDLKTETIITSETKKQKRRDAASHQKKDKTTEDILGVIENVSDSEGKFLFSRFYNFYQGVEKVSDPTARSRLKALGYYPDENCPPGGTPYWRKKE